MNTPDPHIPFADLRRAAIDHAQDASGEIWTDYNLHDPGVTLVEQTCFALSQISYQANFDVRDLLTASQGVFAPGSEIIHYRPRRVLQSAPVTDADMNAYLSALDQVGRAWLMGTETPGLSTITVVPAHDGVKADWLECAVRNAYAQVRMLGRDVSDIQIAEEQRAALMGNVEISGNAFPERIIAELYFAVGVILRGLNYDQLDKRGATRRDAFDDPLSLFNTLDTGLTQSSDLTNHFNTLRRIPGLQNIVNLALLPLDPAKEDTPQYYALRLPRSNAQIELTTTLDGTPVQLDHSTLREEWIRLTAERIGAIHHTVEATDWTPETTPGKRRDFSAEHVDALLPNLYTAHGYRPAAADTALARYRGAIDGHLQDLGDELETLPLWFAAMPDPSIDDPVAYRKRLALLDYRIALLGETVPATHHTGLHHYRSAVQRHAFELSWRSDILRTLAKTHAARGAGSHAMGFENRLRTLADLPAHRGRLTSALGDFGLSFGPPPDKYQCVEQIQTPDHFADMIVPLASTDARLTAEKLRAASPWLNQGAMTPDLFSKTADPDAFLLVRTEDSQWSVVFDGFEDQPPFYLDTVETPAEGTDLIHALRATWRDLHIASEGFYLIEDIGFARFGLRHKPHVATLLVTGWSARTQPGPYRNYLFDLVQRLTPAHMHMRIYWLDFEQMQTFEDARATKDAKARAVATHTFLDKMVKSG